MMYGLRQLKPRPNGGTEPHPSSRGQAFQVCATEGKELSRTREAARAMVAFLFLVMTLVTRNTADVADLGAKILNPFEADD